MIHFKSDSLNLFLKDIRIVLTVKYCENGMTNVVANVTYIISVTWTYVYCKLFCLIYAVFPGVAKWALPSGGSVGKGAKGGKRLIYN